MTEFQIVENGTVFATIEARTAKAALRKATKQFPRRRCDYNMDPGDEQFTVEWRAFPVGSTDSGATAIVTVPGRSDSGCRFA